MTGITPAAPTAVLVTGPGSVTALSVYTEYDWTVQVMYAGGMSTISLSACTVEYADSTQSTTDEDGNKYTGFVYDSGGGYLKVTYTEAGSASTYFAFVEVLKVPYPAPYMPDPGTYAYTAEDGAATTTAQDISIRGFNPDIMEIVSVQYSDSAAGVEPAYDTAVGTFEATEAGEYTVRVALTNEAYYFQDHETDETYLDLTYTLEPAEPPIGIEWSDGAYEGGELRWNRDDDVSFTLLNNYGGGDVTYTYSKEGGGTTTGSGTEPNLPNETGTYTLTVSVAARGNFTAVEKELATFTIGKRVLGAPTLSALTYTGVRQAPFVTYVGENDASYLSVTNAGGTAAGTYTATFEIVGTEAVWSEDIGGEGYEVEGSTLTITYSIAKLAISAPSFTDPGYTYSGSEQTAALAGWAPSEGLSIKTPVTLEVSGGASAELASGELTATNAGTYTVTASLGDTDNLVWSDGETANKTFTWTIAKKAVEVPTIAGKTYNGEAQTADIASSSLYDIAQGSNWVDADTYTVTLTLTGSDNYKWADDTNPDASTVAVKKLSFTITPLELTIEWSDTSFTYDGVAHKPTATAANAYARDDISLTVSGEQTNAGTGYTAQVVQIEGAGADNYTLPEDVTCKFTIVPRVIEAQWGTLTQIYDGDAWNPEATIVNLASQNGVKDTVGITYQVTAQAGSALSGDEAIDVGGYTLTINKITNTNYTLTGASGLSQDFTITPYAVDKPTAMANVDFTYNGGEQTYMPEGYDPKPFGESTMTIDGNVQINANTYTVTVSLASDNYKWSDGDDRSPVVFEDFVIKQAELTVQWGELSAAYDEAPFVPEYTVSGWMPEGDSANYTITYEVTAQAGSALTGDSAVNAGSYHVALSISEGNYYLNAEQCESDFTITKAQISVSEIVSEPDIEGDLTDGDRRIPFTNSADSHLEIVENTELYTIVTRSPSGNAVDQYTVTIKLTQPENYAWTGLYKDDTFEDTLSADGVTVTVVYEITMAQVKAEVSLSENSWTYGGNGAIKLNTTITDASGAPVSAPGDVTYLYYEKDAYDEGGRDELNGMPTNVGEYYVVASVAQTGAYSGTTSDPVSFTIEARTIGVTVHGNNATYGEWQEAAIADADIADNATDGGGFTYEKVTAGSLQLVYESTTGAQLVAGKPRNAGSYTVTAKWADGVSIHRDNFILNVTGDSFTISPRALEVTWDGSTAEYGGKGTSYQPEAASFNAWYEDTIDGLGITYTVTAQTGSALTGDKAVDVGSYTVAIDAITNANYTLTGASGLSQEFTITPYTIAFTIEPQKTVYGSFTGDDQIQIDYTQATIADEDAKLSFSYAGTLNGDRPYTDKFEAGKYTVTATIGNKNYQLAGGAMSQEKGFTIERYMTGSVSWWGGYDLTYCNADLYQKYNKRFATTKGVSFYNEDSLMLDEKITQNGVEVTFQDVGTYLFEAKLTTEQAYNYVLSTTLTFTHEYTIKPAEIGIDVVEKSEPYRGTAYDASEVFTGGLNHSYTVTTGDTFGVDLDEAIAFEIAENKDAGSYAVTLTFTDPNFTVTGWTGDAGNESKTFENAFTITPALLTPSFTYDGGTYGSAKGTVWRVEGLVNGETQDILNGEVAHEGVDASDVWDGAASPAGSYTITLTIGNPNYTFTEGETDQDYTPEDKLVVDKYTITSVDWEAYDLVYTGADLYKGKDGAFASATGVNDDGTLDLGENIAKDGSSADFIAAGEYTFTATIGDWDDNYELGSTFTHNYTIEKADITVDGAEGYEGTYDAAAHNALVGGYTAATVDGRTDAAEWTFIVGGSQPAADAKGWTSMPKFTDAGEYTVWYKVSADNHKDVIDFVTVRIKKIAISIAIYGEVTYGYGAAETFEGDEHSSYEARATQGDYANGEDFNTLLQTGLRVDTIETSYSKGDTVGENLYVIYTAFLGEADNYTVTAVEGRLTVNKRAVTVWINDAGSDYLAELGDLTWSCIEETFYNGEVPFELRTTATNTSPVGPYYIYPVLNGYAKNYEIEFQGSGGTQTITADGETVYEGEVGSYTIGVTTVSINITAPGSLEYDGAAKQYSATTQGGEAAQLTPVYYVYNGAAEDWNPDLADLSRFEKLGEGQEYAPVDAGYYRVQFTSENPNFTAGSSGTSFEITARAIGVTITPDTDLTYDAQVHPVTLTFTKEGAPAIVNEGWNGYTVTYEGVDGTVYAASSTAPVGVGSYKVTVRVTDRNYAMADAAAKFAIERRDLTVTVLVDGGSEGTIVYGDAIGSVAFSVSYSGFADGEDERSLEGHDAIVYLTRDSGGNAYAPGAAAGSVYKVTTESLSSDNYNIIVKAATLTVEQRAVTVTIHDQATTYTGVTAALTQDEFTVDNLYEGDVEADLCVTLATTGVNAGTHDITATYENGNYDVTFEGNGSQEGGNTWGKLTIGQATLTVTVQDASITYGDALDADALFTVKYSGFVNNEGNENGSTLSDLKGTIVYTTENKVGGAAYAQGDAAGSEYTISARGLTSSNYTIVFEEGTLTVEKRVVTVSVTPGSEQYHYGDPIAAIVEFTNEYGTDSVAHEVWYRGTCNNGAFLGGSADEWVTTEPVNAGAYFAKVEITDGNYIFAEDETYSGEFGYDIAKRLLDADWEKTAIQVDQDITEHTNRLLFYGFDGYEDLIDTVLSVGTQVAVGKDAQILQQAVSDNDYTIVVNGVAGTYTVVITIEDFDNYTFDEGDETTIGFEVSAELNELSFLDVELGWTYGTPAAWTNGTGLDNILQLTYGDTSDIIFSYAVRTETGSPAGAVYSKTLPSDAGSYWVRAYYPGNVESGYGTAFAYAGFTISPKKVAPPALDTAESTYNEDVYNGTPLTNNVNGYVSGTMTVSSTATIATSTEGGFTVCVQTSNAGEYTVTIALTSDNFVWEDGTAEAVVLTWTVRAAEDNAVAIPDAEGGNSWTYGDAPSTLPQATATYGTAVYAYALLPEGFTGEDYSAVTGWTGGFPTDAGKYVVRGRV